MVRITIYTATVAAISLTALALLPGIPSQFNILAPLDPTAPSSALSKYKVSQATSTPEACLAILETLDGARYARLQDRTVSEQCYIRGHVQVRQLSEARLAAVSTSCDTALRLYLWERHSLQTAAQKYFGTGVSQVGHLSSYSCRRIRTETGEGAEMSAHSTASAIDISSVTLTDGRRFDLLTGWANSDPAVRGFWREALLGACDWFGTVLGPNFNRLHADHLHLGQDRWGACR